jgi:MFS family permease
VLEAVPVKRDLTVLYASVLASRIGFGIIIIVFPTYIRGSLACAGPASCDIQIATTLALYPLLEAAAAIPVGMFVDSHGRRWMFLGSLGYIAVLMATIGLTRNLYLIATIHALMGIGAAGVTVATLTMVTDLTGTGNRGKGMGTFDFSNLGGYAIGLVIGSALSTTFAPDLGEAFFVGGGLIGAAFLVGLLVLREPNHMRPYRQPSLNPLYSLDAYTKSILPIWIGVTVLLGMVFFLPTALGSIDVSSGQTAEVLLLGLVLLGLGAIGFGALSDRVGRGRVLAVGVVGLFGLMVWLLLFGGGRLEGIPGLSPFHFAALGILALMTSALVPSILATVGDRALLEARGSAMGLYSVMLSGGAAIGTVVAGFAHRKSGLTGIYEAGIILFTVAVLVSLSMQIWVRSKRYSFRDRPPA